MTTREFSFRQELLLEKGAEVIGDYMRYENKMNLNDEKNPICILHDFVWNAKQDILASTTPEELDKIEGIGLSSRRKNAGTSPATATSP